MNKQQGRNLWHKKEKDETKKNCNDKRAVLKNHNLF